MVINPKKLAPDKKLAIAKKLAIDKNFRLMYDQVKAKR